jgi:enediyne biosynthesis protein E4
VKAFLLGGVLFWTACGGGPSPEDTKSTEIFRDVAAETGLRFHHFTGATGHYYMPEIMGSGVALFDYDSDGDLDVYLVQGAMLEPGKTALDAQFPLPEGHPPGARLFRNELIPSGELRFTDVTDESGAGLQGYGMGVAAGDYNNDGHPDLYVTNFGGNVLLRNNGDGTFSDVTREAGADDPRWSTSAAFLDYDRDGHLDLFVTNYLDFTLAGNKVCRAPTGETDYCTPRAYNPVTDRLFRNEGNGTFTDRSLPSRVGTVPGPGLGVMVSDVNQDGWPDIFVANDGAANFLWINQRDGTFRESGLQTGAAYSQDGMAKAGMGVTAGDFDNDGIDDILVVNLAGEGATLFRNDGAGQFTDGSVASGIGLTTYPYTGFGVKSFDYDNDGLLDLFIANGAVTIMEAQRGRPYPFEQRNLLLRNTGAGKPFEDVSARAGAALALSEVSRGAAFGDIDNDGDLDIVVTNNNGPVRLLRNELGAGPGWLQVRLVGAKSNRMALGARVGVFREGAPPLWRLAHTDASYLSASDVRVHFGLGDSPLLERIEVHWPDGSKETWTDVRPNRIVTLTQGTGQ